MSEPLGDIAKRLTIGEIFQLIHHKRNEVAQDLADKHKRLLQTEQERDRWKQAYADLVKDAQTVGQKKAELEIEVERLVKARERADEAAKDDLRAKDMRYDRLVVILGEAKRSLELGDPKGAEAALRQADV